MARFSIAMHVEVEAETKEEAFADVRSNYSVHGNNAVHDFYVDEPVELAEDESIFDI